MAGQYPMTARTLAGVLTKRLGRPISDKTVRGTARTMLGAFDKTKHPQYQAHGYTAQQAQAIERVLAARGTRTAPKPTVRKAPASRTTARKASPTAATAVDAS
jgi:hypothetical protein